MHTADRPNATNVQDAANDASASLVSSVIGNPIDALPAGQGAVEPGVTVVDDDRVVDLRELRTNKISVRQLAIFALGKRCDILQNDRCGAMGLDVGENFVETPPSGGCARLNAVDVIITPNAVGCLKKIQHGDATAKTPELSRTNMLGLVLPHDVAAQ